MLPESPKINHYAKRGCASPVMLLELFTLIIFEGSIEKGVFDRYLEKLE